MLKGREVTHPKVRLDERPQLVVEYEDAVFADAGEPPLEGDANEPVIWGRNDRMSKRTKLKVGRRGRGWISHLLRLSRPSSWAEGERQRWLRGRRKREPSVRRDDLANRGQGEVKNALWGLPMVSCSDSSLNST